MDSLHLDSSSFHVDGNYINNTACEEAQRELKLPMAIRDHRPDLKQFILDLMCRWGYSLVLESETVMNQTQQCLRPSSRTSNGNGKSMPYLCGCRTLRKRICNKCFICVGCRVPGTWLLQKLLENMPEEAFNDSVISGYRIAPCCSEYGGVALVGRWKSSQKDADLKQLEKRLTKHLSKAQSELRLLSQQEFAQICSDCWTAQSCCLTPTGWYPG